MIELNDIGGGFNAALAVLGMWLTIASLWFTLSKYTGDYGWPGFGAWIVGLHRIRLYRTLWGVANFGAGLCCYGATLIAWPFLCYQFGRFAALAAVTAPTMVGNATNLT